MNTEIISTLCLQNYYFLSETKSRQKRDENRYPTLNYIEYFHEIPQANAFCRRNVSNISKTTLPAMDLLVKSHTSCHIQVRLLLFACPFKISA